MHTETLQTTARDEIRAAIDDWIEAVQARDVDRIMALYAPEVVSFDAIVALQFKGWDAYRDHWRACLDMSPGEMVFRVQDLTVTAEREIAFGHYLVNCGGTNDKGELQSGWMRATVCWRRIDGRWRIVHEHFSAPFDFESGKALLDLKP